MTRSKMLFGAAVFVIMSATLMLQIIVTRLLSVIDWYYLAFFVIGIAMFGLSSGGIWVYLRKERFTPENLTNYLSFYCIMFAYAVFIATFSLIVFMPLLGFLTLTGDVTGWLLKLLIWGVVVVGIGLPFVISGIIASLALTRSKYKTEYVYACDLIGAASGCLLVLALLSWIDGVSAMIFTALMGLLSASIFQSSSGENPSHELAGWRAMMLRTKKYFVVLTMILVIGNVVAQGFVRPWASKGSFETGVDTPDFIGWNSFSRITATPKRKAPAYLWGPSPYYDEEKWNIEQRWHEIDGDAGTPVYRLPDGVKSAEFLDYDLTNLAYQRSGIKKSAVVGVGAGRDLLSAKYYGIDDVTGVEINNILLGLLFDDNEFSKFAGINRLEGITAINDEARNWFARTDQSFDLIQMSLIDTWAATGAGAFTLSENALYTVEGWTTFLRRLNVGGTFSVSRWFDVNSPHETGRILSLAMDAGFALGYEDVRQHIFVATSPKIATFIIAKEPISNEALDGYKKWVALRGFDILVSPDREPDVDIIGKIIKSKNHQELLEAVEGYRFDLSPPTDNQPFFFNQLPMSTALSMILGRGEELGIGVISGNLLATKTLMSLFLLSILFVAGGLLWPLRRGLSESKSNVVIGGSGYFLLIGLGFMFAEIGLMQRFSIFLGHPTYALGIVLFSLILATGLGSALSSRFPLNSRLRLGVWIMMTSGYLLLLALTSDSFLNAFQDAQFGTRSLITLSVIMPAGLLMGFAFPTGMNMVNAKDNRPTPWFWGLNGAAGVLASVLALIVAISYGIDVVLAIGAGCYLLLIPSISVLNRPSKTQTR